MWSSLAAPLAAVAVLPAVFGASLPNIEHDLATRAIIGGTCTAIANPPKAALCGERGQFQKPNLINKIAAAQNVSFATCRDWCFNRNAPNAGKQRRACSSFSHDSTGPPGLCNLYSNNVNDGNFAKNPKSTVTFFSVGCFTCDRDCPLPDTTTNLLDNPGFEVSTSSIGPWLRTNKNNPAKQFVIQRGHNSPNSLLMESGVEIQQNVGTCAGQDYQVFIDYRFFNITTATPVCSGNLQIPLGDGQLTIPASSAIAYRTSGFSAVERLAGDVFFVNPNSNCTMLLDNTVVKPIAPPATAATVGDSMLVNGDFETGDVAPWMVQIGPNTVNVTSGVALGDLGGSGGNTHYMFQGSGANQRGLKQTSVTLQQTTSAPTDQTKVYVLKFDYRLTHHVDDFDVSINQGGFSWAVRDFTKNNVATFARTFTGSGIADTITLTFAASTDMGNNNTQFIEGVELDNIAVFELAQ